MNGTTDHADALRRYYATPAVADRLAEYCATGPRPQGPTCRGIAALEPVEGRWPLWEDAPLHAPGALPYARSLGVDLARTIEDARAHLIPLDVDYQNSTAPASPFIHPADVFTKLEPVYRAVRRVLGRYGLATHDLMTGRGYHFTGQIPAASPASRRLEALAPDTPSWADAYAARRPPGWPGARPAEGTARLWLATGLLLEFVAHDVLGEATDAVLPTVVNGTVVGDVSVAGHECVSLDLSACGDPIDMRCIRLPFSTYQLHRLRPDIFGADVAVRVAPFAAVPRHGEDLLERLAMRALDAAAHDAARRDCHIPDCSTGLHALIDAYERSTLADFHREFYRTPSRPPASWPMRTLADLDDLPACVRHPLAWPNDLLLQPAALQHITRALLARGWAARDIASLVWWRYSADCGWGTRWQRMDARTRAEFDVRVFAGLVATGRDRAVDFNCVSAQEKGLCPRLGCPHDLRRDRERLLAGAGAGAQP